jgi:hypothetical protein
VMTQLYLQLGYSFLRLPLLHVSLHMTSIFRAIAMFVTDDSCSVQTLGTFRYMAAYSAAMGNPRIFKPLALKALRQPNVEFLKVRCLYKLNVSVTNAEHQTSTLLHWRGK